MHITPATPGTLVVLAATILLILVSVSTPLLKSIWFLKASIDVSVGSTDISGQVTLGAWGYCVGDTCTDARLGYSLDVQELFGVSSRISGISTSVLKWITYLMILHPIAAAFGVISVIFGLLAHMRNFAGTALTTCFASFAATFSLLAFVFDIAVFVIAKQRIESSDVGGKAELGSAIWMTLAAMIMFGLSGCFFGCGACIIRKRRADREASEKVRPLPDEEYGSKMRHDALASHLPMSQSSKGSNLPTFVEHEQNEHIPLTAMPDYDDHDPQTGYDPVRFASSTDIGAPSIISGVGEGYGRRNPGAPGMPVSIRPDSAAESGYNAPLPVGGVGSKLGAEARANRGRATSGDEERLHGPPRQASQTTEPFVGMYGSESQHPQPQGSYHDPYALAPPVGAGGLMAMPEARVASPPSGSSRLSPSHGGAYPPYPSPSAYSTPAPSQPTTSYSTPYADEKQQYSSSSQPFPLPNQPPQQQYYVQNPSAPSQAGSYTGAGETGSLAPTYYTHEQQQQQQQQHQAYPVPPALSGVTYNPTGGSSADQYGTPYGYEGSRRY
ncbi:hypothetical protein JCM11641_001583 [Rhodosporidiobolus odoratus]